MTDPYADDKNDAYRALGRYIAEFSRLMFQMRSQIISVISSNQNRLLATVAIGETAAYGIATSFFALCVLVADLDVEEKRIGSKLEELVLAEGTRRNDYAHGDWFIGWGSQGAPMSDPALWRTKPARKEGAFRADAIPTAELDAHSDEIVALRQLVAEFGAVCFGLLPPGFENARISDVFEIEGSRRSGKVVRKPDAPTPLTLYH